MNRKRLPTLPLLLPILLPALAACSARAIETGPDPHSFSRPEEVRVRHLVLDLDVRFDTRRLEGSATLELERKVAGAPLILDTRELEIRGVTDEEGRPLPYRLGGEHAYLGRPLMVDLGEETRRVRIDYATTPGAAALQWLAPEQTEGGRHPFLYTQSQSILARSWIPCQDTPSVRMTYDATVRVPPPLLALMSAENPTEPSPDGLYRFQMPQAIPSYLLALAAGELAFRPLGPRSGVYAEPGVVERAAWEFGETESMMSVAESLYGPYRWGRYDILVLPPSFPFGGMENPRLTFATPTILAGDRSLASLVAHELAHSWSGNLVTNATWNDFWLNEGFTTYIELRIMEALRGRDYADMLRLLGRRGLEREIERLGGDSPDTRLSLDLSGRDPDDGMTDVAYEKGRLLLEMLERHFGRERFDAFLRDYFDHFAFTPVTTDDFVRFLAERLAGEDERILERVDHWIHGTGLPDDVPPPSPAAFEPVERALAAWSSGAPASALETDGWNTHQWLHFLENLPEPVPVERMRDLDEAFHLTETGNAEILDVWLRHAIRSGYRPADERLERFLLSVGRLKFLEPLYRALAETEEGRARARSIFERARERYHPITSGAIRRLLDEPTR